MGIPAPEKRIDQYPHQFSGGMRQRVVIALALCVNPRMIIADEPTTPRSMSPSRRRIIKLLKRLCKDHGAAVMLITHDMGVIAETADRVAVSVCRAHRRDRAGQGRHQACQAPPIRRG